VAAQTRIDRRFCTNKVHVDYPHVGLYDVTSKEIWIARRRWGVAPVRVSHARLLIGGSNDTSTAEKDRFVCYWYHTPGSASGYVHGYPIEWSEGQLLIRLDLNWNYLTQQFIPSHESAKVEKNIDQQYDWAKKIFDRYVARKPKWPLSYHMLGPRPADSMFYVERVDPGT